MQKIRAEEVPTSKIVTVASGELEALLVPADHALFIGHPTEEVRVYYNAGQADQAASAIASTDGYDYVPAGNVRRLSFRGPAYPVGQLVTVLVECPNAAATRYVPVRVEQLESGG